MSTTLEAGTDAAAEEAAAALAEADAERDAANAETARLAEEAAATGLTQAEREATAGFDAAPAADAAPASKRKPRTRTPAAQGNLAGGWETLIGGSLPNERKVKISGGGVVPENKPETILVESRHRIVIDVIAVEHKVRAKLDKATGNVSNTGLTNVLEIVGATFLDPDEYITRDSESE